MLAGAFAVSPSPGQGDITMSNNRVNGTLASSSWRSTLPIHPAAELFPRMSPDELRALGKDVVKNGLKSPIVMWRPDSSAIPTRRDQSARCNRDRYRPSGDHRGSEHSGRGA